MGHLVNRLDMLSKYEDDSSDDVSRKEVICWTDAEWDKLADIVTAMRLNDVTSPLVTLVKSALDQFPEDRRRKITGAHQVLPLVARVGQRMERLKQLQFENDSLKSKVHPMTDEEIIQKHSRLILDNLTPEERLNGLTPSQILASIPTDELAAETVRRIVSSLTQAPTTVVRSLQHTESPKSIDVQAVRKRGLKKVCIIGCKGDQNRVIEDAIGPLCTLRMLESNQITQIPDGWDHYVVWINFVSHAVSQLVSKKAPVTPNGHIRAVGGVGDMLSKLQSILTE